MKKLECYYAHTIISYNSTIEQSDIELLEGLGFKVVNPNTPKLQKECKEYTEKYGKENVMDFFREIMSKCDIVAFRPLPNGKLPSGVAAEVQYALDWKMPIIELPCSLSKRMLTYPETKTLLAELGFYKIN